MTPSFDPPNERIRPYITQDETGQFIVKANTPAKIRKEAEAYIKNIKDTQNFAYGRRRSK